MRVLLCVIAAFLLRVPATALIIRVPSPDHPTIQSGIDAAVDGDSVVVLPGTYHEVDLNFGGKAITVSGTDPLDPEVVAGTVVAADRQGGGFLFESGEGPGSVLQGLTVKKAWIGYGQSRGGGITCRSAASPRIQYCLLLDNFSDSGGGGILCSGHVSPSIANCRIEDCSSGFDGLFSFGGGVACRNGASPTMMDCVIADCRASGDEAGYGGGVACLASDPILVRCSILRNTVDWGDGMGVFCYFSSPLLVECEIRDNYAANWTGGYGGGAYCWRSSPSFVRCRISGNYSRPAGGGLHFDQSDGLVLDCMIRGNDVGQGRGGAIAFKSSSEPIIRRTVFVENHGERGGALHAELGAAPLIEDCRFSSNEAKYGGAFYVEGASIQAEGCGLDGNTASSAGGAIYLTESSGVVSGCELRGNFAVNSGGAIKMTGSTNALLQNCLLAENQAGVLGGGVDIYYGVGSLTNCVLAGNEAPITGGGVSLAFAEATISQCTLSKNRSRTGGGLHSTESTCVVESSILWNNVPDEIVAEGAGETVVRYTDIVGGWPGEGNIDADPFFRVRFGHDFLLGPMSPCVDAGDPTTEDAISDWHPRWPDWYPNSPRADMGAYGGPGNRAWVTQRN